MEQPIPKGVPSRKDKPPLILVVDDDKDVVRLIKTYLQQDGFRVSMAFDGIRAVVHALHDKPDLIIMDLMLPRLSGYEAIRRLQTVSTKTRQIPVMILSGKPMPDDQKRMMVELEPNVVEFVTKPITRGSFMVKLHRILQTGESEKDILTRHVQEKRHLTDGEKDIGS